jgi:hypothetical protein
MESGLFYNLSYEVFFDIAKIIIVHSVFDRRQVFYEWLWSLEWLSSRLAAPSILYNELGRYGKFVVEQLLLVDFSISVMWY